LHDFTALAEPLEILNTFNKMHIFFPESQISHAIIVHFRS